MAFNCGLNVPGYYTLLTRRRYAVSANRSRCIISDRTNAPDSVRRPASRHGYGNASMATGSLRPRSKTLYRGGHRRHIEGSLAIGQQGQPAAAADPVFEMAVLGASPARAFPRDGPQSRTGSQSGVSRTQLTSKSLAIMAPPSSRIPLYCAGSPVEKSETSLNLISVS